MYVAGRRNEEGSEDRRGGRRRRGRRNPRLDPDSGQSNLSDPEYDVIKDDLSNPDIRVQFTEDHLFKYGTPDPASAPTGVPCVGCGAELHSR